MVTQYNQQYKTLKILLINMHIFQLQYQNFVPYRMLSQSNSKKKTKKIAIQHLLQIQFMSNQKLLALNRVFLIYFSTSQFHRFSFLSFTLLCLPKPTLCLQSALGVLQRTGFKKLLQQMVKEDKIIQDKLLSVCNAIKFNLIQQNKINFDYLFSYLYKVYPQLYLYFFEMSKANSFKSQPWTSLEKGSYSIFEDDFLSDKLTFKTSKKGSASTVTLKESFHLSKEGKITKSDQELKFWFPFRESHTLYFRLKNDSYKVHYDNGVQYNNGFKYNFYTSIQGKRSFSGDSYKAGLQIRNNEWSNNIRIAFKPVDLGVTLYHKLLLTQNRTKFQFINVFQAIAKSWIYSSFQANWQDNYGNEYFLRANAGNKYQKLHPANYLTNLIADYIYKFDTFNNLGIQVKANLATPEIQNTAFIWEHKIESPSETGVKIKADLNRNISASIKKSIEGLGNYIFGVNIHDFGGLNRFTYGFQLDLNI